MNQVNQEDSFGSLSIVPLKHKRGRPRKDPRIKHTGAAHVPPGFSRMKEPLRQKAVQNNGIDIMVGQPVTGVVEASFDAGYLLSVRIGSGTKLRGLVFKPGHHIPVTAANDVAPHVEMIRRNKVQLRTDNQTHGQQLTIQAGAIVPSKRKHSSSKFIRSAHPVGVRGNVVPVALQPVNFSNGSPSSNLIPSNTPQASTVKEFGDTDVHMVEPLAMLPPHGSVPISQNFMASQPHSSLQVSLGSELNNSSAVNEDVPGGLGKRSESTKSTDTDTSGSSYPSDSPIEDDMESMKTFAEDSESVSTQGLENTADPLLTESLNPDPATKPFFSYGTGRMTELLKAVQENMKENNVGEKKVDETVSQSEATVP